LHTPEWAEKSAREISSLSVAKINGSGVRIIGSLDNFGSAEILVGENSLATTVSLETAAQALIAINKSSLRRHSSKVIFREALRRVKKKINLPGR
jgi:hypothetical protein